MTDLTDGLITGFKNIRESVPKNSKTKIKSTVGPNVASQAVDAVELVNQNQPKPLKFPPQPTVHHKTPREGKYKNSLVFTQKQKRKQIQKLVETKKKHYEKFLKVFKDDIKGCNITFEEGEKEQIMRRYIKEFKSPKSKSGNISQLNDIYIDESTGANTESAKFNNCINSKIK